VRSVIGFERPRVPGNGSSGSAGAEFEKDSHPADQQPRQLATDPRRRHGSHAEARRLLAENGGPSSITPGIWDGLLKALRRHTIQASIAALGASDRQVLRMAYLEGLTNLEIAATLSVSTRTVRRRISAALEHLDGQIRGAGTWASTIVLAFLALGIARARAVGGLAGSLRATPVGNVVLVTAVGAAATAVVVGAVITNQGLGAHDNPGTATDITAGAPLSLLAPVFEPSSGGGTPANPGSTKSTDNAAAGTSVNANSSLDPGCDGNPTSAPPTTPVGPRTHPAAAAPVTHPTAGGCGPHGVETS
jgi:DNA-binding CsgD family transcriptional regulator